MYKGYRVKINGEIFPNSMIAKGSYSATPRQRVAEIWTDAVLVEHEVSTNQPKQVIEFDIIAHDSDQHGEIVRHFQQRENEVEFYDDLTDEYRTGSFRREDITFRHDSTDGGRLHYTETPVMFTEN